MFSLVEILLITHSTTTFNPVYKFGISEYCKIVPAVSSPVQCDPNKLKWPHFLKHLLDDSEVKVPKLSINSKYIIIGVHKSDVPKHACGAATYLCSTKGKGHVKSLVQ